MADEAEKVIYADLVRPSSATVGGSRQVASHWSWSSHVLGISCVLGSKTRSSGERFAVSFNVVHLERAIARSGGGRRLLVGEPKFWAQVAGG